MSTPTRLYKLDALRALSVLLVVVGHSYSGVSIDQLGVTIFFVISGYIITKLLIRERHYTNDFAIVAFFMRRILKIVPPLMVIVIIPSLILLKVLELNLSAISSQMFFYFNYWAVNNWGEGYLRGSGVVWSLSIEEQFYVVVAVIWLFIVKNNLKTNLLGVIYSVAIFITLLSRYYLEKDSALHMTFYTQNRMSAIAIGGLIAIVLDNKNEFVFLRPSKLITTLVNLIPVLISISLIVYCHVVFQHKANILTSINAHETFKLANFYTLLDLAAFFIVLSALNTKGWPRLICSVANMKLIQIIGVASYSIYLVHHIVILCFVPALEISENKVVMVLFRIFLGILAGLTLHFLVDARFETVRAKWRMNTQTKTN